MAHGGCVINGASGKLGDVQKYVAIHWHGELCKFDRCFSRTRGTKMDTSISKNYKEQLFLQNCYNTRTPCGGHRKNHPLLLQMRRYWLQASQRLDYKPRDSLERNGWSMWEKGIWGKGPGRKRSHRVKPLPSKTRVRRGAVRIWKDLIQTQARHRKKQPKQPRNNQVQTGSNKEAVTGNKMTIIHRRHPEVKLEQTQNDTIQNKLLNVVHTGPWWRHRCNSCTLHFQRKYILDNLRKWTL
jgi:hypothetical protein